MAAVKRPYMAAVSGVKNSGKTTFLEKLVTQLKNRGYQVAVIKHDGHEFEADIPGTDSWRMRKAGAYGSAVFSKGQWMVSKAEPGMDENHLAELFPEADIVLLEGFKNSDYPKFELVRKGNSKYPVCDPGTLLGLVTDIEPEAIPEMERTTGEGAWLFCGKPVLRPEDWNTAADLLEKHILKKERH